MAIGRAMATLALKRKESTPPDGYVCHLCGQAGHWIQQCPSKADSSNKRQKKSTGHVPVAGVDPSQHDIDAAREMQKIKPPSCFCGMPSRLKKVKRSAEGGEKSRAIGKYFFFCSKKKGDVTACRFARPVEDEMKPKKDRVCAFWAKNGTCKKGDRCVFSHDAAAAGTGGKSKKKADASSKAKAAAKMNVTEEGGTGDAVDRNHSGDSDSDSDSSRLSSSSSTTSSSGSSGSSSDGDDDSSNDDSRSDSDSNSTSGSSSNGSSSDHSDEDSD
mmetsp:Transcript_31599/g.64321  ORF Transcript_31599/g.64321 Transcript_31599/m.64321 type:complete len:272 (-) Transcript_31599:107-922(-)